MVMDDQTDQDQYRMLLKGVVDKMDKASSKDCFYIAVALSKNLIALPNIPTDMFYMLYLNATKYIEEYNLYDLSHFLLLFSHPEVRK
jgi:hypothetical protein